MLKEVVTVVAVDKLTGGALSHVSLSLANIVVLALFACLPAMMIFAPLDAAPKINRYAQQHPDSFKGKVAKYYGATIPQRAVEIWTGLPRVLTGNRVDWERGAYYFLAGWVILLVCSSLLVGLGYLLATRCSTLLKTSPSTLFWTPLLAGMAYLALGMYLGAG